MNEIDKTELSETSILKLPSKSETTPLSDALSNTVAPGNGTPSLSTIVPEIIF